MQSKMKTKEVNTPYQRKEPLILFLCLYMYVCVHYLYSCTTEHIHLNCTTHFSIHSQLRIFPSLQKQTLLPAASVFSILLHQANTDLLSVSRDVPTWAFHIDRSRKYTAHNGYKWLPPLNLFKGRSHCNMHCFIYTCGQTTFHCMDKCLLNQRQNCLILFHIPFLIKQKNKQVVII